MGSKVQITDVSCLSQHGKTIFSFKLPAAEFLKRGIVRRLSDNDPNAIQRPLFDSHALNIALAMTDPNVLWPDSLVVSFMVEPTLTGTTLELPDDYTFLVD